MRLRPVLVSGSKKVYGKLNDIGGSTATPYPLATTLEIIKPGGKKAYAAWSEVEAFDGKTMTLREWSEAPATADFWAKRDVLDDQVVDLSGAKVVRVNDINLIYSEKNLIFCHVEVGLRGILRRLKFERAASFMMQWLFDYEIKESFVTWKNIQVMSSGSLQVKDISGRLAEIHPAEMADILEELSVQDRRQIFDALPPEAAADTLEEVEPEYQRTLVASGDPERIADVLEEMSTDEAADVLRDMAPHEAQSVIAVMEKEAAEDVRNILSQEEETVGREIDYDFVSAKPTETVGEVLAKMPTMVKDAGFYTTIYVADDNNILRGVLSLRELFLAAPEEKIAAVMTEDVVVVHSDTGLKDAAKEFAKYGFLGLPVVEKNNELIGVVRNDVIMTEMANLLKE